MGGTRRAALWMMVAGAALGACSGGDDADSLREGLAGLPRDTASEPARDTLPEALPDTIGLFPPAPPPPAPDTTTPPLVPGAPNDTRPWTPADPARIPGSAEWRSANLRSARTTAGPMTTLRDVRTAENEAFDRVVLEFAGDELPGYDVEYVDRPVRQCGSGNPLRIGGDGWLRVRMEPAQAHDDRGRATVEVRARQPNLPVVRELRLTCDFEGQVEWVIGVGSPNRYRVLELHAPARLVVDIAHER